MKNLIDIEHMNLMIKAWLIAMDPSEEELNETVEDLFDKLRNMAGLMIKAFDEYIKNIQRCKEGKKIETRILDTLIVIMLNYVRFDLGEIPVENVNGREDNICIWLSLVSDDYENFINYVLNHYSSDTEFFAISSLEEDPRIQ